MRKTASEAGQDLRTPVLGGTKFPTDDSKSLANKQLSSSTAEVGPAPKLSLGPTLDEVSPVPKPKWASIGEPMDPILTDPLVLYLKKTAAKATAKEPPPLSDLLESDGALKNNHDRPDLSGWLDHAAPVTKGDPMPTKEMRVKGVETDTRDVERLLFLNDQGSRAKFDDKDHVAGTPPKTGLVEPSGELENNEDRTSLDTSVIDRILGL